MIFETNKDKGNTGLAMAIAYFGANGYTISVPLNDTQDYDLIVDKDNVVSRVQIKATNSVTEYGSYSVSLSSQGGTKGIRYKTLVDTDIEILFIFCGDKTMYLIPKNILKARSSININKKLSKFAPKDAIDYSQYIVEI